MIKNIAFDGIHKSGKSSQIKLIKSHLSSLGVENIVVRGEYNRPGSGKNFLEDPFSLWWQENRFSDNYDEKSRIINRELFYTTTKLYPNYLKKLGIKDGVIIQDRSIAGKYLFNNTLHKETPLQINISKNSKNPILQDIIIPDLIFILQPDKEDLLMRLEKGYNKTELEKEKRYEYKKNFIEKNYDLFYSNIEKIPNQILKNIILIKGTHSKNETAKIIKENIMKILLNEAEV